MNTRELKAKRAALIGQARALVDGAGKENRELSAEEQRQYDALLAQIDQAKADIDRLEKLEAAEASLARTDRRARKPDPPAFNRLGRGDAEITKTTHEIRAWYGRTLVGGHSFDSAVGVDGF